MAKRKVSLNRSCIPAVLKGKVHPRRAAMVCHVQGLGAALASHACHVHLISGLCFAGESGGQQALTSWQMMSSTRARFSR